MRDVKCSYCDEYRNEWCEKVIDSPHPDILRDCQYFHEAKTRWIPCSERLPEKEGHYFVTDEAAGMAETLIDKYICCDDGEWVWLYSQHVVAWMELPNPYEGGEQDDHTRD